MILSKAKVNIGIEILTRPGQIYNWTKSGDFQIHAFLLNDVCQITWGCRCWCWWLLLTHTSLIVGIRNGLSNSRTAWAFVEVIQEVIDWGFIEALIDAVKADAFRLGNGFGLDQRPPNAVEVAGELESWDGVMRFTSQILSEHVVNIDKVVLHKLGHGDEDVSGNGLQHLRDSRYRHYNDFPPFYVFISKRTQSSAPNSKEINVFVTMPAWLSGTFRRVGEPLETWLLSQAGKLKRSIEVDDRRLWMAPDVSWKMACLPRTHHLWKMRRFLSDFLTPFYVVRFLRRCGSTNKF